ncbi:MAG: hypothetical protein J5507_02230 [Clostridia bacterium]|nr:hypothetical protein [Clostridia bacterium]
MEELGIQTKKISKRKIKVKKYVFGVYILTVLISLALGAYLYVNSKNILISILATAIVSIPVSEIIIQLVNYVLAKVIKPKLIPKMDFGKVLPKEYSTFVVIPTIVNSKEKVRELIKKLEVYYLANKSENLYFALLGDCTTSKNEVEREDNEIIKTGLEEVEKLNKKYNENLNELPKFHFLYRKRTWNAKEECYLGWERKRGLLCQFNEFLVDCNNKFCVNTINDYYAKLNANTVGEIAHIDPRKTNVNKNWTQQIKYVITLDSDTNLILGSALELIGAMAHILNKPILNKTNDCVIEGHGILQPRVGINLEASRRSIFTKIYTPLRRNRFIYKCNF